jgi:Cof subfamily protein (haloacid dehalogenase superfamily)
MTYQALAIDLDGTLLVGEDIPDQNLRALRAARDAGYRVIIATARWVQMAERVQAAAGLDGPIIACSGAQVFEPTIGIDLLDTRLPADFAAELFAICNAERCVATITLDGQVLVKLEGTPQGPGVRPEMQFVPELDSSEVERVRVANIQGGRVYTRIVAELKPRFESSVNFYDSISPNGKTILTITARAASKGTALSHACAHLGISPAAVVAFGDAENDIDMFRAAGASVAMGQADAATRAAATWVTRRNDEAGVAHAIWHLLARGTLA